MLIGLRHLTEDYAVAYQITADDIAFIKAQGFQSIINHRPDDEEPAQPRHADIEAAAQQAGLAYVHIPIAGVITPEDQRAMQQALSALPKPIFAFCRSGARSTRIWAHALEAECI